jgi:hypothetical protein
MPRIVAAVAFAAMCVGIVRLERYAATHGAAATPPLRWPSHDAMPVDGERPTVVLFLHAQCPCSDATIGEFAKLHAHAGSRAQWFVVRYSAPGAPVREFGSMPGVVVRDDPERREASRFGVQTSGQVLVYGADGQLRFAGGITVGRGHAGDNAGATAARIALTEGTLEPTTPVYGCGIREAEAAR